jgi:cytochrome bd-type quinol oxidase subunit 1
VDRGHRWWTDAGASPSVHAGTALFTLIGFSALYFVLGLLFLYLVSREIAHGPTALNSREATAVAHGAGGQVIELCSVAFQ